jgi:ethanolamine utilization protein EutN
MQTAERHGLQMLIGKVVGSVVSTRKSEKLIGNKFMIIELAEKMSQGNSQMIAIDNIGAGIGEYVLVATGSAARIGSDMENAPVDAAIVGIIDDGRQWM